MSVVRAGCLVIPLLAACSNESRLEGRLVEAEATEQRLSGAAAASSRRADALAARVARMATEVQGVAADYRRAAAAFEKASANADSAVLQYRQASTSYEAATKDYRLTAAITAHAAGNLPLTNLLCAPLQAQVKDLARNAALDLGSGQAAALLSDLEADGGGLRALIGSPDLEHLLGVDEIRAAEQLPVKVIDDLVAKAMAVIGCENAPKT